ncbi:Tl [Cordylochernes scorpioides]|uniref:Tl n=1 Tax=Cordylochernes scorpioides TaxID=51811 RepID=A0ABY6KWZ9_9ARAC|nr:Tl [Cordylochernes scorpioides]
MQPKIFLSRCLAAVRDGVSLSSPAKCELRSVIRFLNEKNNSPVEIHRQLVEVYGEKCMDIKNVRKWCQEFNEGRINVHDEQRSGRPSLPESTVARIDEMVRANRRITLEEIEDGLNEDCSHFSVHKIVSETLGYRKVSARWVDKWLKEAAGEWYNTGITKLVDRMKKVIEHQGDYSCDRHKLRKSICRWTHWSGYRLLGHGLVKILDEMAILLLAATMAAMLSGTEAINGQCTESFPWQDCFCDTQVSHSLGSSWELFCYSNFEDVNFVVTLSSPTTLHIECHESHPFIPGLLHNLSLTAVNSVTVTYCSTLPENLTFADVLSSTVTSLTFEQIKAGSQHQLLLEQVRSLSPHLLHLNLKNNQLESLPPNYFEGFQSLYDLKLHGNRLKSVPQDLLTPLTNLTSLQLGTNQIDTIEEKAFTGNSLLKQLHLYQNQIANLSEQVFSSLPALELLDLTSNLLETLPANIFSENGMLESLSLKGNNLKIILPATLNHNIRLKFLDLSRNSLLGFLPESLLETQEQLESLVMEDCKISELPSRLLHSCRSLQDLNLRYNKLTSLPPDLLEANSKLKKVDLSFNQLGDLPGEMFKGKKSLTELLLAKNNLASLPRHIFDHTINLESLNLASNRLSFIPESLFLNLHQLKLLELQENQISAFGSKYICFSSNLMTVNLTSNLLPTIDNLNWSIFLSLKRVEVEWNALTEVAIPMMMSQTRFYLRNNNITRVNISDLSLQEFLTGPSDPSSSRDPLKYSSSFYLRNNPLNCDCKLYNLYAYRKAEGKNPTTTIFPDFDALTCSSPSDKVGRLLTQLGSQEFLCPLVDSCPFACVCSLRAFDKAILVDCRDLQLSQGPVIAPYNVSILDLRGNQIDDLEFLNSPIWKNLTHLYLDNNSISVLSEWKLLPEKLEVLSLSRNSLGFVPDSFLELLSGQSSLHLYFGSNPWNCTCALRPFKVWITEHHKRVEDLENVYCFDPVVQNGTEVWNLVAQLTDNDICPVAYSSHIMLIIALSISLFLIAFLLFVISVLYYRNRNLVIAYIFIHFNNVFLCFFKETDLDEDKVYDAFVSYSSTETEMALELISELEEKPPYFKLCVHERDWLPGHMISWNIANSVQNSRKTILVLSRAFLESMWFQVEFRTAYYQMLEDRIDRLIVIIKGDLPPKENLDHDLQFLLSTKTYLVYGEKWFWEKLRYAMPHKKVLENPEMLALKAKPNPAILSTVEQQMSNFFAITNGQINKPLPPPNTTPVPPKRKNRSKKPLALLSSSKEQLHSPVKESCSEFVNQNFVADENDIVMEEKVLKPMDTTQPATLILSPLILNSKPLNGTLGRTGKGKDVVDNGEEIFMLSAKV